ncbi:histidine phosphatase family protein [Bacillus sp. FJAT-29953]|nr:histidine phosphatase family protein [Bacillus sp. FJAT-29953]
MGTCDHMDVYLVRHGITNWNKEKRYLGHSDIGVIRSELSQLNNLQKVLSTLNFDHVFTSDLRRCQETLAYLSIPSQVSIDCRLREINFGDWEGKTYDELKNQIAYRNWLENWEVYAIPNGESVDVFQSRIDSFFNELFQQAIETSPGNKKKILVMTHGGVIRYLVSKYVSSRSFWDLSISHGHGIRLTFEQQKGEWVCSSLLAVPFQEKEK